MSTFLFDKKTLDTSRYISIGLSLVPIIGIYGGSIFIWGGDSEMAGDNVVGVPSGWIFSFVWALLVILWALAMVLASFHYSKSWLMVLQTMSIMTTLFAVLWLYFYSEDEKATSAQILIATNLFACLLLFTHVASESNNRNANGISSLCTVPLFVWTIAATLFNYVEINKID